MCHLLFFSPVIGVPFHSIISNNFKGYQCFQQELRGQYVFELNLQGEGTALPKRNEGTFGDGAYTPDNSAPGLVDNTMNAAHSPTCSSRGPIEIQEPSRSQQTSHAQTASLDPENSIGSTGAGSTAVIVEEKFESISETEACTLFGQWVEASDHQEWKSVEVITNFAGEI